MSEAGAAASEDPRRTSTRRQARGGVRCLDMRWGKMGCVYNAWREIPGRRARLMASRIERLLRPDHGRMKTEFLSYLRLPHSIEIPSPAEKGTVDGSRLQEDRIPERRGVPHRLLAGELSADSAYPPFVAPVGTTSAVGNVCHAPARTPRSERRNRSPCPQCSEAFQNVGTRGEYSTSFAPRNRANPSMVARIMSATPGSSGASGSA